MLCLNNLISFTFIKGCNHEPIIVRSLFVFMLFYMDNYNNDTTCEQVNSYLPREKKRTLLSIEEECYSPIIAFSFFSYFHIHWFGLTSTLLSYMQKMGVAKGAVHIFPKTPCYSYRMILLLSGLGKGERGFLLSFKTNNHS